MSRSYRVGDDINYASIHSPNYSRFSRFCESRLRNMLFGGVMTLAAICGGFLIGRDMLEEKKAYNSISKSTQYQQYELQKEDTYWGLAVKLRRENPHLRTLNAEEVGEALKKLNSNRELIAGQEIKIPEF